MPSKKLLDKVLFADSRTKLNNGVKCIGSGDWDFSVFATHKMNMSRMEFDSRARRTVHSGDVFNPKNWDEICNFLSIEFQCIKHLGEWQYHSGWKKQAYLCNDFLESITDPWHVLINWHVVDHDGGNFRTITVEGVTKFFAFGMATS